MNESSWAGPWVFFKNLFFNSWGIPAWEYSESGSLNKTRMSALYFTKSNKNWEMRGHAA
jgi:hypothetical protein